jgi:hypothetical protein
MCIHLPYPDNASLETPTVKNDTAHNKVIDLI